jgi:hypothetical protein
LIDNGIPYTDSESHGTYCGVPDFASSVEVCSCSAWWELQMVQVPLAQALNMLTDG